jgi:O-antigen/teichoic acid export membrane protein
MMLSTPWLVARPLTVLQLRSRLYAVVSTGRIIISSAVILIALFAFDQGRFSLFLGMLTLGFVDFAGAFLVLMPSLSAPVDRKLLWGVARKGAAITGGSISNMFFPIIERSMLAGAAGAAALGLYVHAQSYQRFLTDLTDPLRQLAWPQLLAASWGDAPYARSVGFFSLMYAFLIFSGLVFALIGRTLIDLLTHGRFGGAAPYAAIMIAILLLILLARPQYAVISAAGDARAATLSTWISTATAAGLMVVAVPLWGPFGLLGAVAARYLILALCFHFFARLHKATPVMDGPPLFGAVAIVALTATMHLAHGNADVVVPVLGVAITIVGLSVLSMTNSVKKFDAKHRENPDVVLGAAVAGTGS